MEPKSLMERDSVAQSAESYFLTLVGAITGGIAAGYAAGWILERSSPRRGLESVAEGFQDVGTILGFGFLGAAAGCYMLLRVRRHAAAGTTAGTLLAVIATSTFLVYFLPTTAWVVLLLLSPLLARYVVLQVRRHRPSA